MVYSHVGLLEEAHRELDLALEINPNNTMARFRKGVYFAYQGKFDGALRVLKTVPRDVSPMLVDRCKAEIFVQTGRLSDAEEIADHYLNEYPQDEGGSFTSVRSLLLAKAGKSKAAEDAIARAVAIGSEFGHFHHTAHNIASAYAAMNMLKEAVRWLEKAADTGFPNYTYFEIDPNLDSLRQHKDFVVLMKSLHEQWQHFKTLV